MPNETDTKHRSLATIAREIKQNWVKPYFGAVPYLNAMMGLDQITDQYGADDAESIVLYFLSNASSFRGPIARILKAELKAILQRCK